MGDGLDTMKYYKQASKIRNGAPTNEVGLTKSGEIIVGKFVDRERNEYGLLMHDMLAGALGGDYAETEACTCQ
jgi:2-oxoglutarate ferredoxin oxidoreductase subunit beta